MAAADLSAEELLTEKQTGRLLTKEGSVNYLKLAAPPAPAIANQFLDFGDGLRTLESSRASVRFTDLSSLRIKELSRLQILPRAGMTNVPTLRLDEGQIYISSRGGDVTIPVVTPQVRGKPKGTEFLVAVDAQEQRTEVTMFDGEMELTSGADTKTVRSGQQGIAIAGQPIQVLNRIEARKIVQWWIYYPGILDPAELPFAPAETAAFRDSFDAYRSGDLPAALRMFPGYPTPIEPTTDAARVYLASLLLSVGSVERAETLLAGVTNSISAAARALRIMMDAVQDPVRTPSTASHPSVKITDAVERIPTSSEWLALSYAHQATNNLHAALAAARSALSPSPLNGEKAGARGENGPYAHSSSNGFVWARIAELEFGFAKTREAQAAVQRALELSPRNAQAHAVRGFLLATEFHYSEALAAFDRSIELDPALGNAWLGRGLVKRRMGKLSESVISRSVNRSESNVHSLSATDSLNTVSLITSPSWLSDLQTAAIVEPRRSLVRAYAGKAFSDAGRPDLALKELDYAAQLDRNDPTSSLYKALELRQQNRPNEAVRELERSIALNDNRAVYRSRLLLDQDHSTRSASLAKIYQDAGLEDVALREAARAVSHDYASHSAHQFLAESYNALRDPTRFNLRYETVWFNELLLANILSPVGAGLLSQNISQQEYASLFEHNRLGLTTSTEYRSDGQLREIASHYGLVDRFAYTLDLDYQHNNGTRPNNDLDRKEWYSQFKYQLTDRDSLFLLTKYQDYESGDNFQHYDPSYASRKLRIEEKQAPIVMAAFHREWSPGVHTTLLGGLLQSDVTTRGRRCGVELVDECSASRHQLGSATVLQQLGGRD